MKVELTDLTGITRDNKRVRTTVYLHENNYGDKIPWLIFGQAEVRNEERICWLDARMTEGVSDFEHDSAHALRLPLIGLKFEQVWYHTTYITAWVDPNNPDGFHVPRPGYNPMKHPDAEVCEADYCGEPHPIVPQGYYVPPFDKELYEAVKGKKIEIIIGLVNETKDEAVGS